MKSKRLPLNGALTQLVDQPGCRSSRRSNWLVGPLGSTSPPSYLSKAFSPTFSRPPASLWDSFSFWRTLLIVAGEGIPFRFFFQGAQSHVGDSHVVADMNIFVTVLFRNNPEVRPSCFCPYS
jgi:hypothetical protein